MNDGGPDTGRTNLDALIVIAIVVGGFYYFWHDASYPEFQVFDEHWYLDAARQYRDGSYTNPEWGPDDPRPWNFEHPPLGKEIFAASLKVGSDNPYWWRLPSSFVGAIGLAGVFMLARNLTGSRGCGAAASAFLALDPMYYLHARLAQLDIFVPAFLVWSFAFVLDPKGPQLAQSALFFGLAAACKYTALFFAPILLVLAWVRVPREPVPLRLRRIAIPFVGIPAAILLASYLPHFVDWAQRGGPVYAVTEFVRIQGIMLGYGYTNELTHGYASGPIEWFLLTLPVYYFYWNPPDETIGWAYSLGNPAIWWPAIVGMIVTIVQAIVRAPRRIFERPVAVLGITFFVSLAPFFIVRRVLLNFYATAYTPFLSAALAVLLFQLWRQGQPQRILAILVGVIVAAVFVIYYPIASGVPRQASDIDWIFSRIPWMERLPEEI